jgi:hypothetical protein
MVNKKNKSNRRKQNRGVPRGISPRVAANISTQICSVTDPFCSHARGAKYNTSGNPQTLTYQCRQIITVTTGASGWAFFAVDGGAHPGDVYYQEAAATAQVTVVPPDSGIGSFFTEGGDPVYFRVVSSGFRIWDVAPRTAAGGVIVATDIPDYENYTSDLFDLGTIPPNSRTNVADRRVGCGWTSNQTNRAYPFISATAGGANTTRSGCLVAISGDASSVVAQIELVFNYEYMPQMGATNFVAPATSHGRIARPVQELVDEYATNVNPHFDGSTRKAASQTILDRVNSFVRRALPLASAGLGFLEGGPVGAIAGFAAGDRMIRDVGPQEID